MLNKLNKTYLLVIFVLGIFLSGCEDTDIGIATQAAIDAVQAVTLDDEDIKRLAIQVSRQSDMKHEIAPPGNPHAERLKKLTGGYNKFDGHEFDFKVYLSPKVNAFAMADGSIRIYSGLMDIMEDQELLFVVGHEMGHVVEKHVKKKIMFAYAGSAVRKAIASQQNPTGEIARSVIGALAEDLLNAQFSQQEEREADDYGLKFLKQEGHRVQAASSALMKLATLGNDHSFLSSHPAPESRAKRVGKNPVQPEKAEDQSFISWIIDWLKGFWPF